jgi:hypothetical protein
VLGHKEGLVDLVNVVVGLRQVRTEGYQGLPLVFREQCRYLNCNVQARDMVKHVCLLGKCIPTGPARTSPSKRSQLRAQLAASWVGILSL